ncbi:hypothetical protein SGLAM104S_05554 [Streptomyces glaucescens]
MSGLACWTTARTLAPPVNDWAPNCWVSEPTWRAMTAPKGMETRAAGRMVTPATNQNCSTNSRNWKGRRKMARATSAASIEQAGLPQRAGDHVPLPAAGMGSVGASASCA